MSLKLIVSLQKKMVLSKFLTAVLWAVALETPDKDDYLLLKFFCFRVQR